MAENSKIQWTTHTWNPWRGCQRVSPGCTHCYAETTSRRNPAVLGKWGPAGAGGTRVLAAEAQWREPVRWNREAAAKQNTWEERQTSHRAGEVRGYDPRPERPRVFCASIADVFEDWTGPMLSAKGDALVREPGIAAGDARPFVDTKFARLRPRGRFPLAVVQDEPLAHGGPSAYTMADARARLFRLIADTPNLDWLLLTKRPENVARMMPTGDYPNVWLGTTVECQEYAWRLDALREARDAGVRAAVLFCSAEPLLGPLDLTGCLGPDVVSWVICGGESGGRAREFHPDWAKSLLEQCRAAGAAFFMKQLGDNIATSTMMPMFYPTGRRPNKGGDWLDLPAAIRVRNVPAGPGR